MNEVTLTWKNGNIPLETRQRVQNYFEINHLNCKVTETGLYITCDNEKKAYSYMWIAMYDLVKCNWFRAAVQSCVWRDGFLSEDIMKSCVELIANGRLKTHD